MRDMKKKSKKVDAAIYLLTISSATLSCSACCVCCCFSIAELTAAAAAAGDVMDVVGVEIKFGGVIMLVGVDTLLVCGIFGGVAPFPK